jgi:hypothetical protein
MDLHAYFVVMCSIISTTCYKLFVSLTEYAVMDAPVLKL